MTAPIVPEPRRERLFFAACPPPDAAEAIVSRADGLGRAHGVDAGRVDRARLHVTLAFLGSHVALPAAQVEAACGAAERVSVPPVDLVFDHAGSLPSRGERAPWVLLGGHGAHTLHDALQRALARAGIALPDTQFTPHVTLGRDAIRLPLAKVEPVGWTVRDFVLLASATGTASYRELGRWALGRAP